MLCCQVSVQSQAVTVISYNGTSCFSITACYLNFVFQSLCSRLYLYILPIFTSKEPIVMYSVPVAKNTRDVQLNLHEFVVRKNILCVQVTMISFSFPLP